jgi:hypothetical protein
MIGGLGMVESAGAGMPPVGVEYVLSTPQGRAVLRPLRYPFYDTERIANGQVADLILFADHKKFTDGTNKTECDDRMAVAA